MQDLYDLRYCPIDKCFNVLLKDRSTNKNIIFATDMYDTAFFGSYITKEFMMSEFLEIKRRASKNDDEKNKRTRKNAEVFTPSWLCNKMNNYLDEEWFGRKNVFNIEDENKWVPTEKKIVFPEGKTWKDYVLSRVLEITCGEAPYIASRYDAVSGEVMLVKKRIGILDRKLRVVNENTSTRRTWLQWVYRAFESVYGYEYQGDNLFIARFNLLRTFCEYYMDRWIDVPSESELMRIAKIISWNFWQMDGLKDETPSKGNAKSFVQREYSINENGEIVDRVIERKWMMSGDVEGFDCKIKLWNEGRVEYFKNIKEDEGMKFDFVIGNPPYQEENTDNGRQSPIYNYFMEESYKIAACVEMIHPARFLFNAGQTPKSWNNKMLNDPHFKVLHYEADGTKIFPTTDIKGGVAVSLRNSKVTYGSIKVFTRDTELNDIIKCVLKIHGGEYLNSIISSRGCYRTSEKFLNEFPESVNILGKGTGNMIASNFFEKLPNVYELNKENNIEYIGMLSRVKNKRTICYIKRKYVQINEFMDYYNVAFPKSSGRGVFGEVLSPTEIIKPNEGSTDTFINIGMFETLYEAKSLQKYIMTKFLRTLLGAKKVTQDNPKSTWSLIPLQDFSSSSDIDWSKSISEIDQQLYKKYGLSEEEIEFIEKNVKEME